MVTQLGTGGRLSVVIGVPGSGKTFALRSLTQAWHVDGRNVYGISLAWRQAGDLKAAGIQERSSIAAFLRRVETGRYNLNPESVIVVDEVGLVGSRQMLELLRVRERTGAQLVLIGDPRQNQPIEGASGLELLRAALGDTAISRLLKSVRQDSDREREIAALFRRGAAAEALQMKQQDGTAILVAGGPRGDNPAGRSALGRAP
jgi:ATP-dependent exoDNAse (exonuclease V) alpha subunit